ncbi:MAG: CPXCG motif-containing cysteine-rich protein [Gammaproteobacteria bacterium]|nr:CPXCG motif-containing cysteine-rich protein [Gammaproteobacteria bacterium]
MLETREQNVQCPYCGETINVLIDCSVPQQSYIEDCQVCCCPIEFNVVINQAGKPSISVCSDNE